MSAAPESAQHDHSAADKPSAFGRYATYLLRVFTVCCVLLVIALAVAAYAIYRWVLPDLHQITPRIEAQLSTTLKQPVTLDGASILWDWRDGTDATLLVKTLSIGPQGAPNITAQGLKATVKLHPLLWGEVQTTQLSAAQASVRIEQRGTAAAPHWWAAGFDLAQASDGAGLRWVMQQDALRVDALTLNLLDQAKHWLPEQRRAVMLRGVSLRNRGDNHTASLAFAPEYDDVRLGAGVTLSTEFKHSGLKDLTNPALWHGQAIINAPQLRVAATTAWLAPLLGRPLEGSSFSASNAAAFNPSGFTSAAEYITPWLRWVQQSLGSTRLASSNTVHFQSGGIRVVGQGTVSGLPVLADAGAVPAALNWSWASGTHHTPAAKAAAALADINDAAAAPAIAASTDKPTKQATVKPTDRRTGVWSNGTFALGVSTAAVSVQPLTALMQTMPLPEQLTKVLALAKAAGDLSDVNGSLLVNAAGLQHIHVDARAQQLALQGFDWQGPNGLVNIPSFAGIAGTVSVQHQHPLGITSGKVQIDAKQASAELPRLLEQAKVTFDSLAGNIGFKFSREGTVLNFDQIRLSNADAQGEISGEYTAASRQQGSSALGVGTFTGAFSRADIAKVHRYMPLTLPANARAWLRHTLAQGKAEDLQFTLNGDLSRFPFLPETAQAGERFDLQAKVSQGVLNFNPLPKVKPDSKPDTAAATAATPNTPNTLAPNIAIGGVQGPSWPLLESVSGTLKLNGLALTLLDMEGTAQPAVAGAAALPLRVPKLTVANLTQPVVVFNTRSTAPATSVLALLSTSPLMDIKGTLLETLTLKGNVTVDAALSLDIAQSDRNTYQGSIQTEGVSVDISPDFPPFEQINATLAFKQNTLRVEQGSAQWLGGTVQLTGSLNQLDPTQALKVQGMAQLASIKQFTPNKMLQALLSHATGAVDYSLGLNLLPEGLNWQVTADLNDAALQWPGLLDKAAGVPLPFSMTRKPSTSPANAAISQDVWDVTLGATVLGPFKAHIERQVFGKDWRVLRGAVALGVQAELNTPEQGLGVHIVTPKVNLDQLQAQLNALPWKDLPTLPELPSLPKIASLSALGNAGGANDTAAASANADDKPSADAITDTATTANASTGASASASDNVSTSVSSSANNRVTVSTRYPETAQPTYPSNALPAWMPSVVALQVDDLTVGNRKFYNVVGAAVRTSGASERAQSWTGNLVAKGINGYLEWKDTHNGAGLGGGRLVAKLSELVIPASELQSVSKSLITVAPKDVPSVEMSIDKLVLGDKLIGAVQLKASNIAARQGNAALQANVAAQQGWNIEQFSVSQPHVKFNATGAWTQTNEGAANLASVNGPGPINPAPLGEVRLAVNLSTDSLGEALAGYGYGKLISGTPGTAKGDVVWLGTPFALDLETLSGQLTTSFDKGRFLKVDPGVGKLVGLFSLQNLPKSLSLDFKDTFGAGFAFDSIRATGNITKGVLRTDDFTMKSSLAEVFAKGDVNLNTETQKLRFTVRPDINAGSVSLLYMIINPPVGLATLAAQYLFREPIRNSLTVEYEITGPWAKPDVKQVKREIK
jgi:uncharacterized protein YhdP